MFHLGWFLSYTVQSWNRQFSGEGAVEWVQPELYIEMARSLERAGFDYLMFEDGSFVPDAYGSSTDYYLRNGAAVPKHDPLPLLATIARETEHIGLIGTVTTSFYPPFLAARLMTTLDHLTRGRVGMNLVTAHNIRSAQNYGLQDDWDHDERYARAHEWIEVVGRLWDSWEPGALRVDREIPMFVDPAKVHPIDFEGTYYRSRGPLNTLPGPQRRPVICQAGGSPAGRDFGARYADTIIAQARGLDAMKTYREDVDQRVLAAGRKPAEVKLLFIAEISVQPTLEEAGRVRTARAADSESNITANLLALSYASGVDFAAFDLDAPVPELTTNNARSVLAHHLHGGDGKTLRELASRPVSNSVAFIGTPESIADQMEETVQVTGIDGFLVSGPVERRYIAEISDGLAPVLQRRGLVRQSYEHETFRDNLMAF